MDWARDSRKRRIQISHTKNDAKVLETQITLVPFSQWLFLIHRRQFIRLSGHINCRGRLKLEPSMSDKIVDPMDTKDRAEGVVREALFEWVRLTQA